MRDCASLRLTYSTSPPASTMPMTLALNGAKANSPAAQRMTLALHVHRDRSPARDGLRRGRTDNRQQPVVERVAIEDAAKALGNDRADAVVDQAGGGLLAARTAAPSCARPRSRRRGARCAAKVGSRSSSACRAISARSVSV